MDPEKKRVKLDEPDLRDAEGFRIIAKQSIDDIIDYYDNIETIDVRPSIEEGYLEKRLPTTFPEGPEPWSKIQQDLNDHILPGITHWQSPNFLAYFPANSTYPGMLAELYSAAFTSANFDWVCSPAATELETIVLNWLCKMLDLPSSYLSTSYYEGGGGVIQGSASEAVLTVIVAARDRYLRHLIAEHEAAHGAIDPTTAQRIRDETLPQLVALFSSQAHSCTEKGCMIAGVKHHQLRVGRSGSNYPLTGATLRTAIETLRAQGQHPFYVTVSLGTTSTCAVDDFAGIAAVKRDYPEIWVHVDAAYAGAALVCPEYRGLLRGVEDFDSFDVNMHKWLLTNFDCSCLFVRERLHLVRALGIKPAYLDNPASKAQKVIDYRDWQVPLGRRFRALKMWFVMRSYGAEGLRAHIRRCVKAGERFTEMVERSEEFEIFTEPAFGLTVFKVRAETMVESNRLTKKLYEVLDQERKIFLSKSEIYDGEEKHYVLRIVSGNPRIEIRHMEAAFEFIEGKAKEVREMAGKGKLGGEVNGEDIKGL